MSEEHSGMFRCKQLGRLTCTGLILGSALFISSISTGASLGNITAAADQWMVAQVSSQKRVDKIANDEQSMAQEYRETLRESDSLKLYNKQIEAQLQSQQDEMNSIRDQERNIEQDNLKIAPLMQEMLATLKQFVSLDVPFLKDERAQRVQALEEMMPRADVTVSEKFRRIIETYQEEIDYGRTIGAYTGKLGAKDVNFLRIGRVALLYQTPNGSETGYWDRSKNDWVVDNSAASEVAYGLKVANKETAPDLMTVPIQAAVPASADANNDGDE